MYVRCGTGITPLNFSRGRFSRVGREVAVFGCLDPFHFSSLTKSIFSSLLLRREIHWSSLEALPEDLFADVPKLEILRITSSKLTSLPAGIFTPLPYLYEL